MAKRVETLKRSFALWPVLVVLLFVPAFLLGAWASGLGVAVPEGGNVIPAVLNEYTPAWFTALVVAGAMAAMMSSSDSMLLSGSSYFTRDIYRPLLAPDASEEREGRIARIGVAVFATATLVGALLTQGGGLGAIVALGDTAFGGYAQLTLPLLCALYWGGTTRTGMLAGIVVSQAVYLAHVGVLSVLGMEGVTVAGVTLLKASYLTWEYALWCMLLSLVVTVGVSLVTSPAGSENPAKFGVGAD